MKLGSNGWKNSSGDWLLLCVRRHALRFTGNKPGHFFECLPPPELLYMANGPRRGNFRRQYTLPSFSFPRIAWMCMMARRRSIVMFLLCSRFVKITEKGCGDKKKDEYILHFVKSYLIFTAWPAFNLPSLIFHMVKLAYKFMRDFIDKAN